MSIVQIYYTYTDYLDRYKKKLQNMNIDLDISLTRGDKTVQEIYESVYNNNSFCRDEKSISKKYLLSLIHSDIILYADIDNKVAGVLCFAFNIKERDIFINFNGICSPSTYSRQRVGENLINSLITLAKVNDVKYIKLNCKGNLKNYYQNKYGFEVTDTEDSYDSDDELTEPFYFMKLDLSKSGGYRNRKLKKTNKRRKYKNVTRRKIRKLRKI